MKKKTTKSKRDVVFAVPRGYKFDTEGAIAIAKRIAAIDEEERCNCSRCANCN